MKPFNFHNKKAIFNKLDKKLNGSEPKYDEKKWSGYIEKTHNCYAYAFDFINPNFKSKPQPGYASGFYRTSNTEIRSCDKMMIRIKSDNPSVFKINYEKKCPDGFRKGYFALDDGENTDYHFWRLDLSGLWSHKPGSTKVRYYDYDGHIIVAPHASRRESNSHNYKKSCGYFCYNPKKSTMSNKPIK